MSNTFGTLFRLTTFGESHGPGIGGVVDGMPSGIVVDTAFVQAELDRRRPAQGAGTSQRREEDKVQFLSGIFEGKTTGAPIAFMVENHDARPDDYAHLRDVYRPSHADFTYQQKYGMRDYRGGGRASSRTTLSRVVAGALAKLVLRQIGINITASVEAIGGVACADSRVVEQMLTDVRAAGDTVGAVVSCVASGVPVGWGEPEFGKLHAMLGSAMLSIPAAKGFELGEGFAAAAQRGSEYNDMLNGNERNNDNVNGNANEDGDLFPLFLSNHDGGIQGGISNGQNIVFRVAFKPIPTLMQPQSTVNVYGDDVVLHPRGRHDVCVAPRVVPVVEAMTALVLADSWMLSCATRQI